MRLGEYLEITSMADIPAGTGLGSSGSFTTALLKALHAYRRHPVLAQDLAEQACDIEINRLGEPVGKQDQYIAAFGGLMCFEFLRDDTVSAAPLRIDSETLFNLEDNLLLFFTGYSRAAGTILREQDERSRQSDRAMLENLHHIKAIGVRSRDLLEKGDLVGFGELMNEHWQYKKRRASQMSNPDIDRCYDLALKNGAVGGKLAGAGGGGFLLLYASDKTRLRHVLRAEGLQEVRFRFDFEGSKIIVS
jgi:D-glycero-alpha-D-manno-heptose-7-phosphate kinase